MSDCTNSKKQNKKGKKQKAKNKSDLKDDLKITFGFGSTLLSNELHEKYAHEKWELACLPTGDMTILPETIRNNIRNNMNQFFMWNFENNVSNNVSNTVKFL